MSHGPIMIDLQGPDISELEQEILKHPMVGGVILFFKNCKSVKQLPELIAKIRKLRPEMLIAVDREGGNVQRFQKPGFRSWPAARECGEHYDDYGPDIAKHYTEKKGKAIGEELFNLGIDINFAPVLDSHSDNEVIGGLDRAFHANPKIRTEIAEWFIRAMKDQGIKATGKHCPDHGVSDCVQDSHKEKPISRIDGKTLLEDHLLPYRTLIEKGLLDVIMPAHIRYTAVDSENPVGFSKIWLNEILREQLGFKGAIISDCLSMAGAGVDDITDPMLNMKARVQKALAAGCDMALVCNQKPELLLALLNALEENFKPNPESQMRLAILSCSKKPEHTDAVNASSALRWQANPSTTVNNNVKRESNTQKRIAC
jgi:beta-N-acetylhexosaminidase